MSQTSDLAAVAARLRESRLFLNLSAEFVGAHAGISREDLDGIERGLRPPDESEIERLAALYRLSVAYLRSGRDDAEVGEATEKAFKRAEGELTERERNEVERFALFLQNFRRG
jgi:transcriptional regulator with XRE-family HTH domain